MKLSYITLVLLLVGGAAVHAGEECKLPKPDCTGVTSTWNPVDGFQTELGLGAKKGITPFEQSVCAVRQFCGNIDADDEGVVKVRDGGIKLPENVEDTDENKQQLAADCQNVVASQRSNACYEGKVWSADTNGLYGN